MGLVTHSGDTLAVVPLVVNAGTALLPAIIAGVVSVVSILFRPGEWSRAVRTHPVSTAAAMALVIAAVLAYAFWPAEPARTTRGAALAGTPTTGTDWVARAHAHLRKGATASRPKTPAGKVQVALPFILGVNAERAGAITATGPRSLGEAWRWSDPEDQYAMYCSSLATDGRFVYGALASQTTPPDTFGAVFCLDAETGALRWITAESTVAGGGQRPFKGFFSSPAISEDGKSLLIGEGLHTDADSSLICLDTGTGRVRWRLQTTQHLESSPAIEGDVVVIGAGAIERASDHLVPPGGNPGFVLAVRISDGKELWRHPVNDPESSPAIRDGVVYIGSGVNGKQVVALRTDSDEALASAGLSREVWRTPTPLPALAAVTATDQLVLIACGDGDFITPGPKGVVLALDRATGKLLWTTDAGTIPSSALTPVAVRDGHAYVGAGDGSIVAIDLAKQGALVWRTRVSETGPVNAGVALTASTVYGLTTDGHLVLLDRATGSQIERHYMNDTTRPGAVGLSVGTPLVAGARVYVGSETGGIRAMEGIEQ